MPAQANILVVDDNADLLNTFSLILQRKGYEVDTAPDGVVAVDKSQANRFDLILMDIIMPRMNGVEAFRKIRQNNPNAKVILMTAYYEEDQIKAALDEGAYGAVHKPVSIANLMQLISEATASPIILVVDDDDDFRETMARALQMKGFRVKAASNGMEALAIAREKACHVAFVDFKMPEMNGVETALKLKELNSRTETVMMTGYHNEIDEVVQQAPALKAGCLYKPFNLTQAVEMVNRLNEQNNERSEKHTDSR